MNARVFVVGLTAATLCGAQAANAGVALNTIDRAVTYKQDGALVRSSGPIGCTRGERITIRVTVSQAVTRAQARGTWRTRCTGEVQHWQIQMRVRTEARFAPSRARVCADATTRAGQRVTETRKWCRRVSVSAGF